MLNCRTDRCLKDANGTLIERTMLFVRSQLNWTSNWDVVGLRGTGSDSYTLADVFVPDAYTVRRDIDAERRIDEPFFRFTTTNAYSCGFAACFDRHRSQHAGRTEQPGADEEAVAYRPHAARQPGDAPPRRRERGQAAVCPGVCAGNDPRWRDCIQRTGGMDTENRVLMRLATTTAIRRAKEVAEFAYHEAGATAIFASNPFEQKMRDIHASAQQVQGRTGHIEVCGQYFLGLDPLARHI